MAQVTVSQLASVVGTPVERLLKQMKEAGLTHADSEQSVSDEDKRTLLLFLKGSHGGSVASPKKITLKRKTQRVLRTSSAQGKKTINVEVRQKRTYVRPDLADATLADATLADATTNDSAEAADVSPAAEASEVLAGSTDTASLDKSQIDPEILRQQAAKRRKEQAEQAKRPSPEAQTEPADKLAQEQQQEQQKTQADIKTEHTPENTHTPFVDAASTKDESDEAGYKRKKAKASTTKKRGRNRQRNSDIVESILDHTGSQSGAAHHTKVLKLPRGAKVHGFSQPKHKIVRDVSIPATMTVADLAQRMALKAKVVIKELMQLGVMVSINESIDQETAQLVVEELGHKAILTASDDIEASLANAMGEHTGSVEARAPVVTVMGHVDHGKTSLLDYLRQSEIARGEFGGITQHIGAYHVKTELGEITFLDTPGHAAFTAMRARGAQSTDVVILVVAADDGVMPQTEEAIKHAQAASVPIVVAVNKIDKEGADPDRVRNELVAKGVVPDDWGGDVQFVNVSAHTGEGIDPLLSAVLLQAELLELTAPNDGPAHGVVLESRLERDRGPVVSVLVQAGQLKPGDIVLAGCFYGRIRLMQDEHDQSVTLAGPSIPVEILGLNGMPDAGDSFLVLEAEKRARDIAQMRLTKRKESQHSEHKVATLDNLFADLQAGEKKTLNLIVKADVRGSLEAIQSALTEMGNEEVSVNIVASGVGGVTETDSSLAATTQSIVFGFNVRADNAARALLEKEQVELRYYSIIYDLLDDVKQALSGMLSPELREKINGTAEVRDIFESPKWGSIAGCMVLEGTLYRHNPIRVLRDNVVIYEGELESLRRFKEDVEEVRNGIECGIAVKNYNDVKSGDKIEVYEVKEVARSL